MRRAFTLACLQGCREAMPSQAAAFDALISFATEEYLRCGFAPEQPDERECRERLVPAARRFLEAAAPAQRRAFEGQLAQLGGFSGDAWAAACQHLIAAALNAFTASAAFHEDLVELPTVFDLEAAGDSDFAMSSAAERTLTFASLSRGDSSEVAAPTVLLLEVLAGPHAGESLEVLAPMTVLLGRLSAMQGQTRLALPKDKAVSRNHAMLTLTLEGCELRNLSRNGTRVDGARVESAARLKDGSRIQLGRASELRVELRGVRSLTRSERRGPGLFDEQPFPGLELLSELGESSLGRVMLARQGAELVAVKALRGEVDADLMRRLLREAQRVCALEHPHIVRRRDGGIAGGQVFLVMDYVRGQDAAQLLRERGKPYSIATAAHMGRQLAAGLAAAHAAGFEHRDIKPENVLISERPGAPRLAQLTDFGLRRSLEAAGLCGLDRDPAVTPPEMLDDARRLGPAADIYSLAATIFRLATGEPPILVKDGEPAELAILEREPRRLRALLPKAPRKLDELLARCLAKDPGARLESAAALEAALAALLERARRKPTMG